MPRWFICYFALSTLLLVVVAVSVGLGHTSGVDTFPWIFVIIALMGAATVLMGRAIENLVGWLGNRKPLDVAMCRCCDYALVEPRYSTVCPECGTRHGEDVRVFWGNISCRRNIHVLYYTFLCIVIFVCLSVSALYAFTERFVGALGFGLGGVVGVASVHAYLYSWRRGVLVDRMGMVIVSNGRVLSKIGWAEVVGVASGPPGICGVSVTTRSRGILRLRWFFADLSVAREFVHESQRVLTATGQPPVGR